MIGCDPGGFDLIRGTHKFSCLGEQHWATIQTKLPAPLKRAALSATLGIRLLFIVCQQMEIGTKPIRISVPTAGTNSALNEASVFPSRRIAITDSHSGPGDAATSDGTGPINVATPSFRTRAIQSSGSETLLRIQFLAGCTIGMLESCIRKRQPGPDAEIEPCLPSPVERPPAGADWIHEIKHDGFRLVARRGAERVRLFTRNGNDWSERFPLIVEALNAIKATTCLIDGEAVTCSEAGLADFDGLRNRRGDVHLCAFDLVELDGRDLRLEPLTTRRRLLARLIRKPRWELVLNALFEQDGPLVFEHACLLGCEGIVSKRKVSPYRSGRSRHWVKSKNPTAPAVKREAEEDWGKEKWR